MMRWYSHGIHLHDLLGLDPEAEVGDTPDEMHMWSSGAPSTPERQRTAAAEFLTTPTTIRSLKQHTYDLKNLILYAAICTRPDNWLTTWEDIMKDCEFWCPEAILNWEADVNLIWGEAAPDVCQRLITAKKNTSETSWTIQTTGNELRSAWREKNIRLGMKDISKAKATRSLFHLDSEENQKNTANKRQKTECWACKKPIWAIVSYDPQNSFFHFVFWISLVGRIDWAKYLIIGRGMLDVGSST